MSDSALSVFQDVCCQVVVFSSCPLGSLMLCFDAKCEQGYQNTDSNLCPSLKTWLVYCSITFLSTDSLQLFYDIFQCDCWTEFQTVGSGENAIFLIDPLDRSPIKTFMLPGSISSLLDVSCFWNASVFKIFILRQQRRSWVLESFWLLI